ncbi:MAG: glucosamine kinase [Bacteroidia bacterium]|jgi:glucosamine kinase
MILVADSGSTKCDWILIDSQSNQHKTKSMGFNPFFHDADLVYSKLMENDLFIEYRNQVSEVYFYGAGCSSEARNRIIANGLKRVFSSADIVLVDHDLKGAALATSQGDKGISCILGTGSNSCYFNGTDVIEKVPALGYILGDEGSGSYFGKIMLSEWLYHRMPAELAEDFGKEYNLTKEGIFEAVHNKPDPNVYLASFSPFISKHIDHLYFREMVYDGLDKFVNIHVLCYDNYKDVPVHFVGSIAYYFKEVLQKVALKYSFTVGKIEKRPVEPLAQYHINKKN